MGAVYVADQLSTGKARALKVMRAELVDDLDARRRFEQEARVGARVASDHVVEIHAAGVDGETGLPFLVMELLVGEDLASAIERSGPMPPSAVLAIFEQLCHAIGAAHGAGVVHRDLKPENVFLAKPRRAREASVDVKVLDFGIAKVVEESASRKKSTQSIGTPAVNRSVEAADTTGGLDQCVERQLASVAFPSVEAPTSVTYTLKLNPNGT